MNPRVGKTLCLLVGATLVASLTSYAQGRGQFRGGGRQRFPAATLATADSFDGGFQFCRLAYSGRAWATDYPDADYNFSTRLSELTKKAVSRTPAGEVRPLIVRPSDPALFNCPFVMLWQAESLWFSDEEAARMREYLLKGGFVWADDSWGTLAWENFEQEMAKVLPETQYRFADLRLPHPMYRTFFELPRVPQVPAINYWLGSGGDTSEEGADSAEVHVRGISDAEGRLMVLATHNTDISDGWEREGMDARYFRQFSVDSYAVGINVMLYTMTH
jgi:Domain of unknown function (DUF4159)